ncbi:MAG: hypothetical protein JWP12_2163 [Bacteroidetes bacterium]|nr:hypothetical protein [Bacteroidota bacterium]
MMFPAVLNFRNKRKVVEKVNTLWLKTMILLNTAVVEVSCTAANAVFVLQARDKAPTPNTQAGIVN